MPLVLLADAPSKGSAVLATIDRSRLPEDLASVDLDRRREAVALAARLGETGLLAARLGAEPNAHLRDRIMTILARAADPETVAPLIALLRCEDAALRNGAIETLQAMGETALPEIEALIDDEDSDVRIFAMNVALSLQSPHVPDMALAVLTHDENVNVCAAALDILSEVGRPDMAGEIRAVADRFPDQPFLGYAVRAALKRIG